MLVELTIINLTNYLATSGYETKAIPSTASSVFEPLSSKFWNQIQAKHFVFCSSYAENYTW